MDDQENRSRRNNIRIRGLPVKVEPKDLAVAVTAIFNQILVKPTDSPIEIDHVYRLLGPRNPNLSYPRDVICRIHFFNIKAEFMQAAAG